MRRTVGVPALAQYTCVASTATAAAPSCLSASTIGSTVPAPVPTTTGVSPRSRAPLHALTAITSAIHRLIPRDLTRRCEFALASRAR
jgi:hypothetical protein